MLAIGRHHAIRIVERIARHVGLPARAHIEYEHVGILVVVALGVRDPVAVGTVRSHGKSTRLIEGEFAWRTTGHIHFPQPVVAGIGKLL